MAGIHCNILRYDSWFSIIPNAESNMNNFRISYKYPLKPVLLFFVGLGLTVALGACDLAKNELKIDRSSDLEVQDYRDALAPRLPDTTPAEDDAGIPEFKSYTASNVDKLKPMPLVSISVNQTVPLKDILYEAAEQADYDLELDPRIRGSIIFTARNRPFDEVIDKIAISAGLRYKFSDDSVKIELDTPYHEIYKINYLSFVRKNASEINNSISVVSGDGADAGSSFSAGSDSESDFWGELEINLTQILEANRSAASLITKKDPKITATAETPAPVEPVLLTADGEIAQAGEPGATVQVAAPDAVLKVEPLPVDEAEDSSSSGSDDPFAPRFSINKQAGIISIFAGETLHKKVASYLEAVRKATTSQVLIEAKVLEVSLSDEFSAGIDWGSSDIFSNNGTFGVDTVGDSIAPVFPTPSSPSLSGVLTYATGDLNLAVEAIQRFGTVRALASPRITVINNQSAVLNVATNQIYFDIDVETTPATETSEAITTLDSEIKSVPEGVLINVQPSIDTESQTISMSVRPTITRITSFVNDPATDIVAQQAGLDVSSPVPVVNVQEFDSVIQVNNGQAIVMGGIIQDRTDSTQNAVPVLGEMPLVGALFRNQIDQVQKTELVVFLKATIVEGGNTVTGTDKDLYRSFSQDRRPFKL